MECEETAEDNVFSVLAAYRFRHNVETGPMSNNSAPNVLGNFTPYPIIQLSPQNYKSGTLTGLIGSVETDGGGQPEYRDSLALRDAIMALSVSANPLFLKNRKGDLLRVKISAPVTATTADATREQMQTLSVSWTEDSHVLICVDCDFQNLINIMLRLVSGSLLLKGRIDVTPGMVWSSMFTKYTLLMVSVDIL